MSTAIKTMAQTHTYEAFFQQQKVGELKAVREVNDESEKISVITLVNAQELAGLTCHTESHTSYMDGKLIDATSITKTNGDTVTTQTTFRKNGYTINQNGKLKRLEQPLLFGSDLLYFEEPIGLERVYVFALGRELSLHTGDHHSWSFEYNRHQHVYTYTDGVLTELQIVSKFDKLIFKLKQ